MTLKERFETRKLIGQTPTAILNTMYNNEITDEWTKGAINAELIYRKMKELKGITFIDTLFNIGEEDTNE